MKFVLPRQEDNYRGTIISRFLNPGDFYFGEGDCQIHTILGSCIAITLWHPVLRIGGMCHFVLPGAGGMNGMVADKEGGDGRYSVVAMQLFENAALQHGTTLQEYQAKIFGGSNMLKKTTLREDKLIGTKNTEAAIMHLSEKGIPILVAHVGETGHRRIVFDVKTGDVWVKHRPLQKNIC
jgi:chemotaxis protein CheD